MTENDENWILFEGSFVVPASMGVGVIGKAIAVNRSYSRPMEISNEAMSFRLVSSEEVTLMKIKKKMMDEKCDPQSSG